MPKAQILVVENEGVIAKDIESTLKTLGYGVLGVASTSRAAIEKATELKPDLVLMDISLEGDSDGIEAARQIRRSLRTPVVYLTAYADEATLKRASTTDAFGFVIKPFNERELQATIEMALYRHRLEQEVRNSHEWCSTLLRCIGEAVLATDKDGMVTFMTPVAEALIGWKQEQALGKNLGELVATLDESTGAATENPALQLLRSASTPASFTDRLLLVTKRGVQVPVECSASLIRDSDGRAIGAVAVLRDITQRRDMERAMLGRQKMEAIGKLADSIAHEFGNMGAVISSHAASIAEHLLPGTGAYADAQKILETARRVGDLTKQILSVARASASGEQLRLQAVSLAEVVGNAIDLVEKSFRDRRISFKVAKVSDMPYVMANPGQMLEIVMELFLNAADAMPEGGTITVDSAELTAKPPALTSPGAPGVPGRAKRYAVLRIRDSGVGMTKEVLDRLFEPFYTTRAPADGIGLGLSIVQSAIHGYGGWVKVASRPGHGSNFSLYIPKAQVRRSRATKASETIPKGVTVLVVDDKDSLRAEIQKLLQKNGFRVHAAAGGEEATRIYREHPDEIDISIVDLIMPGESSKDVIDAIMAIDPTAHVVVMSGFSRDYARSALTRGAWNYIQKPFDGEQLLNVIRRTLSHSTA